MNQYSPSAQEVDALYRRLDTEAEAAGYHLNPDVEFTKSLIAGLLINEKRYGYWSCPCRLAEGAKPQDIDIICPCDYRDADLAEFGTCYCRLYVSAEVKTGHQKIRSIPERRPEYPQQHSFPRLSGSTGIQAPSIPVYRCRVCGYLCARDQPPEVCPICKAKKERFEIFISPSPPA
jgi:ferredoxin-thioredoxin reductase catalytic chain